jgi:hypothetical protein
MAALSTTVTTTTAAAASRPRLVLRLAPPASVTWADDVVDNEGLNRRSSKAC